MKKRHPPRPSFLRKPKDPQVVAAEIMEQANYGFDIDQPDESSAKANFRANQARLRRWLDGITQANLHDQPPPEDVLNDLDEAMRDYRITVVPTASEPWYGEGARIELRPPPDLPARLAVLMRDVLLTGLHTRIRKCELKECEKFVFTPLRRRGRLRKYCSNTHKNRHNRRKNR